MSTRQRSREPPRDRSPQQTRVTRASEGTDGGPASTTSETAAPTGPATEATPGRQTGGGRKHSWIMTTGPPKNIFQDPMNLAPSRAAAVLAKARIARSLSAGHTAADQKNPRESSSSDEYKPFVAPVAQMYPPGKAIRTMPVDEATKRKLRELLASTQTPTSNVVPRSKKLVHEDRMRLAQVGKTPPGGGKVARTTSDARYLSPGSSESGYKPRLTTPRQKREDSGLADCKMLVTSAESAVSTETASGSEGRATSQEVSEGACYSSDESGRSRTTKVSYFRSISFSSIYKFPSNVHTSEDDNFIGSSSSRSVSPPARTRISPFLVLQPQEQRNVTTTAPSVAKRGQEDHMPHHRSGQAQCSSPSSSHLQ